MVKLLEQSQHLLSFVPLSFKRYLFQQINWDARLIGVKGARGTGKTTMLLQWLKMQNLPITQAAYFSLDDLYFSDHSLKETVAEFYQQGGKILVLDEVHKYPNWSAEIKNCYDFFPTLKIIFTGSSVIDISRQEGDLSRRALFYNLPGLSFREYLSMQQLIHLPSISLQNLLADAAAYKTLFPPDFRPFQHFTQYLTYGYYPFAIAEPITAHQRINQLVRTIVEYDMAALKDFDVRNAKKLLQLIYIVAQQVPFKPNISALAEKTLIHRNTLNNYLHYLEQAKIVSLLYPSGISVATLQKPERLYLNNTNLLAALAEQGVEQGAMRETFFMSQLSVSHSVNMPKQGDFLVDNKYTFEIGGKSKTAAQIKGIDNAYVVQDDTESPIGNHIPLWLFGFLY